MISALSLEGRTAIVTGASRGIGKAIAVVLAEAGADVAVAARTVPNLEATADEIRALGRRALVVPTDVSDSAQVDTLVERTIAHFGKVDILVNNAGQAIRVPVVPFPDRTPTLPEVTREGASRMSDQEWQGIIDTNLNSVFYGCRAVGPHMLERRYGKIINIGSQNGKQAFPLYAPYNATKTGVHMLTRVLALEWADYNVCVNAIGPGDYQTNILQPEMNLWDSDPQLLQPLLDSIPFHRLGDARELGILAVYLASEASDYMTGQIVYMDGGHTAR